MQPRRQAQCLPTTRGSAATDVPGQQNLLVWGPYTAHYGSFEKQWVGVQQSKLRAASRRFVAWVVAAQTFLVAQVYCKLRSRTMQRGWRDGGIEGWRQKPWEGVLEWRTNGSFVCRERGARRDTLCPGTRESAGQARMPGKVQALEGSRRPAAPGPFRLAGMHDRKGSPWGPADRGGARSHCLVCRHLLLCGRLRHHRRKLCGLRRRADGLRGGARGEYELALAPDGRGCLCLCRARGIGEAQVAWASAGGLCMRGCLSASALNLHHGRGSP